LQAAAQQLVQLPTIPRRKLDLKPYASAHDSAIQPDLARAKYQHWLPIHAVMVLEKSRNVAAQDRQHNIELLKSAEQPQAVLLDMIAPSVELLVQATRTE
jgi:hypothetical protein